MKWQNMLLALGVGGFAFSLGITTAALINRQPACDTTTACRDKYPDLPNMARRWGVQPARPNTGSIFTETMCNGERYDWLAVVHAITASGSK